MEEMDEFRQQLAAAIFDGSETKGPMIQILYAETPFRQKFRCVDFGTLLRNNSQSRNAVRSLTQGVSILEKYGRHLLKPPEHRSNMWRQIKFSNTIFRERVEPVKGAREILQKMGYTETRLDGVAFPEGAEPDHSQVLNVVLDLMIGRKELEHYLENQHPQPSSLEDCLAPGFRQLLEGGDHLQVAGETGIPQPLTGLEVQSSTGSASHQEAHGPAHKQPVIMESQPVGIPNSSPAQALQSQYRQEMEEQPREPQSMQVGTGHQRLDVMNTGAQSMTPGYGGLQLQGVGYNGMGNQMPGQSRFTPGQPASSLALQRNFPQQYNPSVTAQQAWLRQQQQIASQLDPSFHNQPLQGSQSTREPHDEPSNLPALPGHSPVWQTPGVQQLQTQQHAQEYQGARPKYSPVPDKQADDISSPEENKAGSLVCEICGKHTADVLCQMCGSKQLCRECDFKWHSHPKRQNHSLEMLRRPSVQSGVPVSVKPGDPEGAGLGHRAPLGSEETVPVVLRRPPDQQASGEPQRISGYGFPQHQAHDNYMSQQRLTQQRLSTPETPEKMPHYPSNMQYNPTFHAQQHGNMVGHSSNGSNMSGGYVYGSQQPPMVSYMGYPAGMVQQPGHMGQQFFYAPMYPMQSGLPSHMSIQGSYVGPQGSGVGEMGMQHSQSESAISRSPSVGPLPQRSISEKPQHMKHSTSSPKVIENVETPSTGRSTPSFGSALVFTPCSSLLPKILDISDHHKRHSKLEILIMDLNEDLHAWDKTLNEIMLEDPNFFNNDNYQTLTRRKRKHLQEITELDKYKTELEREIHELEEQRGKEDEARMLRDRFQQIQGKQAGHAQNTTVSDNSQQGYPLYADFQPQGPPGSSRQPPYGIIPPNVPQVSSSYVMVSTVHQSVMSSAPGHIVTSSGPYHSAYNPQKYGNPEESPPALAIESMNDGNIEEIKRMLVLDQNPHAPRTNIAMVPAQEQRAEQVAFPPSIEEIESKVSQGQVRKSGVQEGLGADMEGARWQCDHCTYLNELSEKVCGVCYRTSDQKKIVYQSGGAEVPVLDQPSVQKASEEMERCEHCTVDNPRGTKVCQVCNRSQDKYQKLEPILTLQQQQQQVLQQQQQILIQQQKQQKPHQQCKVKPQMSGEGEQPMSPYEIVDSSFKGEPASPGQPNVGKLINDEQDRIYFEKKKAQEDYERKQREEMSASMSRMNIREPETRAGCQERGRYPGVSGAAVTGGAGNAKMNISGEERIPGQATTTPHKLTVPNKNLTRIRQKSDQDKSSDHSSDEIYTSAPSSLDPTLDQADPHQTGRVDSPRMQEPGGRVHEGRGKKPDLNFEEAIQKINQRKEQEQMYQDGKELLLLIRGAEKEGFEFREVELAVQLCGTQGLQPLEWLHDVWPSLAELVANTATANGKKAPQNDVGDVSTQEARSALLKSAGEIEKAVKQCVEDRKQKYAEVSASGEFAREDVLTALYQHSGDVEEVVDQLNQALVHAFQGRLWDEHQNGCNEVLLAARAAGTDSLSNSVISNDDFQNIVKDTNIDKNRRIRMVFVEGKLRSWGRAETVVRILDEDVAGNEGSLQCTLDDIIEAVRNCGDRRSSLIFLKQECGICFSYYPMSKICKLGTCHCNMCYECVKQNFEVVIREKHVRNWCCPLCDLPGLEDEESASEYFEFLALLLNNMVCKEVMMVFDIKLRDWHLQKDPNFRWCAHCVTGFIWDQPDRLEMTCVSCRKKTCFLCKRKWERAHEGLTCEQFTQWKIDNDPDKQAKGVQLYLEENGIDCPSCKMRYSLAKGGCMHFTCPQCGYQFCSGCSQAFLKQEQCKQLRSCGGKGLHCHHPRNCYYYLRDYEPSELQKLLKNHEVVYNTESQATGPDQKHCQVMEQKEYGRDKKDEACGKDTEEGTAGLCMGHYKEYLVGLINKHGIDPLETMTVDQMKVLIERMEKQMPPLGKNEAVDRYRRRVEKFIKDSWKLPGRP
ncbi:uncharacterized protein LOC128243102 isoform X2 [Mya arenaria]|uniref:uncharacterized protein LOC128243102 isoform X2 n=1 Tax=Mya arenaria TaxID=6604 RepID=UPI0022E760B4|nr:uncharacterized protein LOC128243102 isoform X2 [Mya arenaria]